MFPKPQKGQARSQGGKADLEANSQGCTKRKARSISLKTEKKLADHVEQARTKVVGRPWEDWGRRLILGTLWRSAERITR